MSAVDTYHPNKKGYIEIILDNENGDPAIVYDIYIKDNGKIMIFGKYGIKNIHEKWGYINAGWK